MGLTLSKSCNNKSFMYYDTYKIRPYTYDPLLLCNGETPYIGMPLFFKKMSHDTMIKILYDDMNRQFETWNNLSICENKIAYNLFSPNPVLCIGPSFFSFFLVINSLRQHVTSRSPSKFMNHFIFIYL